MCKKSDKMICAVDKENLICFSVVFVEEFQNLFSTFKFTASFDKKNLFLREQISILLRLTTGKIVT